MTKKAKELAALRKLAVAEWEAARCRCGRCQCPNVAVTTDKAGVRVCRDCALGRCKG